MWLTWAIGLVALLTAWTIVNRVRAGLRSGEGLISVRDHHQCRHRAARRLRAADRGERYRLRTLEAPSRSRLHRVEAPDPHLVGHRHPVRAGDRLAADLRDLPAGLRELPRLQGIHHPDPDAARRPPRAVLGLSRDPGAILLGRPTAGTGCSSSSSRSMPSCCSPPAWC